MPDTRLSARQRAQAHMTSTIFSDAGPNPATIYNEARLEKIVKNNREQLADAKKNRPAANYDLPNPRVMRANMTYGDHGVVLPQDSDFPSAQVQTNSSVIRDRQSIPREVWRTNVNVGWNDARHEINRDRCKSWRKYFWSTKFSNRERNEIQIWTTFE